MDNMVPSGTSVRQTMTELNGRKGYSEVVTEGVTRKATIFWGYLPYKVS